MVLTIEDYAKLSVKDKNSVNKKEIQRLLDEQLPLIKNDPEQIRNVITNAIDIAIDKKFTQFANEIKIDQTKLEDDNNILRKVIVEQQKILERLQMDSTHTHIFMSGIPNEHTINEDGVTD